MMNRRQTVVTSPRPIRLSSRAIQGSCGDRFALVTQYSQFLRILLEHGNRLPVNSAVTLRNPKGDLTAASLWANSNANCKLACATAARNKSLSLLRIRRLPRVERLAEPT